MPLPFLKSQSKKQASVVQEVRKDGVIDPKATNAMDHASAAMRAVHNQDAKGFLDSLQALKESWYSQAPDNKSETE